MVYNVLNTINAHILTNLAPLYAATHVSEPKTLPVNSNSN